MFFTSHENEGPNDPLTLSPFHLLWSRFACRALNPSIFYLFFNIYFFLILGIIRWGWEGARGLLLSEAHNSIDDCFHSETLFPVLHPTPLKSSTSLAFWLPVLMSRTSLIFGSHPWVRGQRTKTRIHLRRHNKAENSLLAKGACERTKEKQNCKIILQTWKYTKNRKQCLSLLW